MTVSLLFTENSSLTQGHIIGLGQSSKKIPGLRSHVGSLNTVLVKIAISLSLRRFLLVQKAMPGPKSCKFSLLRKQGGVKNAEREWSPNVGMGLKLEYFPNIEVDGCLSRTKTVDLSLLLMVYSFPIIMVI